MSLPLQDAVLLFLVVASAAAVLAGDLAGYLHGRRKRSLAAAEPATASRRTPRPTPAPLLPMAADLLLVDDSAVARAKLRRLFEAHGYTVQLACDGIEALACLDKGRYGMMVTDLEMPNMDGVELVNTCLRQPQTARLPIIAVSAHENLRAKFNACRNICGVHRKPWADDILLSHVATLIGTRQVRLAEVAVAV